MGNHRNVIKSPPVRQPAPVGRSIAHAMPGNDLYSPHAKLTRYYCVIAIPGCHGNGGKARGSGRIGRRTSAEQI